MNRGIETESARRAGGLIGGRAGRGGATGWGAGAEHVGESPDKAVQRGADRVGAHSLSPARHGAALTANPARPTMIATKQTMEKAIASGTREGARCRCGSVSGDGLCAVAARRASTESWTAMGQAREESRDRDRRVRCRRRASRYHAASVSKSSDAGELDGRSVPGGRHRLASVNAAYQRSSASRSAASRGVIITAASADLRFLLNRRTTYAASEGEAGLRRSRKFSGKGVPMVRAARRKCAMRDGGIPFSRQLWTVEVGASINLAVAEVPPR